MDIDSNQFSERERDVVNLLLQGKSNKQVALELGISNRTVEFHLSNVYAKLGVTSRTEAVLQLTEGGHLRESTGDDKDRIQVKSTVEINGESLENSVKPMARRIPMKTLFYILGGGVLTTLLVVTLVLANPPSKNSDIAPVQTPAIHITPTGSVAEETEVRDLIENFGNRLKDVSLLAPDAAEQIQNQYSEFVSLSLLEMWMSDASKAPGRLVSSPWPDRIEITTMSKEDADQYEITGNLIEVTSTEVNNGGAAARIPVRIVVQKGQGHWLITEYTEER